MTEKNLKTGDAVTYEQDDYIVVENKITKDTEKQRTLIHINVLAISLIVLTYLVYFTAVNIIGVDEKMSVLSFTQLLIYALAFLISFIIFIVAHEYVHYLAYRFFGKIPKYKLKFGLVLKSGMAYCIALEPVTIKASRLSLMMPIYLLVIPSLIAAIVLQNGFIVFLTAMFASGSGGDLWYIWTLRKYSADKYIIEAMPDKSGYEIGYLVLDLVNRNQ